jgi:hypothetical protein
VLSRRLSKEGESIAEGASLRMFGRLMQPPRSVAYNFVVAAGVTSSTLGDLVDGAGTPMLARPELHVKVMDAGRKTVVLWTFELFTQRLAQMRNLAALSDKPYVLGSLGRCMPPSLTCRAQFAW